MSDVKSTKADDLIAHPVVRAAGWLGRQVSAAAVWTCGGLLAAMLVNSVWPGETIGSVATRFASIPIGGGVLLAFMIYGSATSK
jgi:hypothetical protein